jgi:hypothetical protein
MGNAAQNAAEGPGAQTRNADAQGKQPKQHTDDEQEF